MVNESGASVYSASDVAREEFPDLDLTVRGAISFNSSTHLPPIEDSKSANPVTLPPGRARLVAKPLAIGSATFTNTIGIVCVSRAKAPVTGVV